jgi:hypothetical protein
LARQRLRASAKVEGHHTDGKPVVLFLCVHNAGRSQMAMGFFQHLAGDNAFAWSGGSEPGFEVSPAAIDAMSERGIDISREFAKPGPTRSSAPPTSSSAWAAAAPARLSPGRPAGRSIDDVRPVRDDIELPVRGLLDDLGVPAQHSPRPMARERCGADHLRLLRLSARLGEPDHC